MAYNSAGTAAQLVTILSGLSGMGDVQIGTPAAISTRVSAFVTMGGQAKTDKATGVTQRQTRFLVMLAYRLDNPSDETSAEIALMNLADLFMAAVDADRTLGGTCTNAEANSLGADLPEYQPRAGKEYREYPIVVTATQQGAYEVNPS